MTYRPTPKQHASPLQVLGDERRTKATPAEAEFERILNGLNGGVLRKQFLREWVCGKKWIVDFFFPEIRLAIEVDGGYHNNPQQLMRDLARDLEIEEFDITVLHITNDEVFGDREVLVQKLRGAWITAKRAQRQRKQSLQPNSVKAFPIKQPKLRGNSRRSVPSSGGWTSLDEGVARVGDAIKKKYINEGIGGTREAVKEMKKQDFVSMRKRALGK